MSKLVSAIFKLARTADTIEMVGRGKILKRFKNKWIGKRTKGMFK